MLHIERPRGLKVRAVPFDQQMGCRLTLPAGTAATAAGTAATATAASSSAHPGSAAATTATAAEVAAWRIAAAEVATSITAADVTPTATHVIAGTHIVASANFITAAEIVASATFITPAEVVIPTTHLIAAADCMSPPAVPPVWPAPTEAGAHAVATPIPAGPAPAVVVPAVFVTTPDELHLLDCGRGVVRAEQTSGAECGRIGAARKQWSGQQDRRSRCRTK
jgi:hypothetical protein